MFNKKECSKCGNKISGKYKFCPYCGNSINNFKDEDFGILGNEDSDDPDFFSKSLFGGAGEKMINKMLGSAIKMIEKEIQREVRKENKNPQTNFQLFINGKKINLDDSNNVFQKQKIKKHSKEIPEHCFSKEKLDKFSRLSKKEPLTNIRRLSDKVIYEISVPGVKSEEDVSITKFENSIEIKALTKNKAYYKIISINLPIVNFKLENGKLIFELETKEE